MTLFPVPVDLMDREDDINRFIASIKRLEGENSPKHEEFVLDTYSQCIVGADENAAKDSSKPLI